MSVTVAPTQTEACSLDEALNDAAQVNFKIVSGQAGLGAISSYEAMLCNYAHGSWGRLREPRACQEEDSILILSVVGDAWKRLVFDFDVPRFGTFAAAAESRYRRGGCAGCRAELC